MRILLFVLVTLSFLLLINDPNWLVRILPIFFFLFLQELFINKKLRTLNPEMTVNNSDNLYKSVSFDIRSTLESKETVFEIVSKIAACSQGKFFIEKINPDFKLVDSNIEKEELLKEAAVIVKSINGKYIFNVDLLAAYFTLQDETLKTLEKEELVKKDIQIILYWTRKKFHIEEEKPKQFLFHGNGVFDSLVFGWTPETNNYTSDFTMEVQRLGYAPKAIGRDSEFKEMVETLSGNNSSNVMIIGDPGVGKTTLVMNFAYASYRGLLTKSLKNKRVYFLFIDRLLSGAQNKGEIERRLSSVFTEVAHAGNIIVFIENIENIFGGGGFDFDVSGSIVSYLESSRVQIIGTTTPRAYKDFISSKPTVAPLFADIRMEEPDVNSALHMLISEIDIREKLSKVTVTYSALKEILSSANLYMSELSLPGSAVNLLEDVMVSNFHLGKEIVKASDVKEFINEKTGINLSTPTAEEKTSLLNMEDTMHKSIVGQDEAVASVSNAVRRLRSGLKKTQGPVASFLFLGPTGVGKTTTAKILAKEFFGSEERFIRVDMSEFQTQESIAKLLGEMPGEESFTDSLIDKISNNPFSLVLLDEFEKAHPKLLDLFLQILDEGFVTNNKGKKISFSNSIIIATSNAGSEFIREKIVTGNESIKDELVEYILTKGIFRPELINRFDDVVVFHPLTNIHMLKITKMFLTELKDKLSKQFINISFSDQAIDKISKDSFNPDFGARNVRRYIEENIENLVSRFILEEKIKKGEDFLIIVNNSGNFDVEKK